MASPQLIRLSGRRPRVVQLDESEYPAALHDKLAEEAAELRSAAGRDEVLAECADVFEVLAAIAASHGISREAILEAAQVKRAERGPVASTCSATRASGYSTGRAHRRCRWFR